MLIWGKLRGERSSLPNFFMPQLYEQALFVFMTE